MRTRHEIEGYTSLTSVNQGGTIQFMVSTSAAAQYNMDIYRMGWYPDWHQPGRDAPARLRVVDG